MASASAPTIKAPAAKDVRDKLGELLNRTVAVQSIDPWVPKRRDLGATAEYVDDDQRLRVATLFDYALSVYAGAAIGLIPAPQAQEMVKEYSADEALLENLYEVLNILASLYNEDGGGHVKLSTTHTPQNLLPRPLVDVLMRRSGRLDLDITIQGYGTGRAAFVLAGN